MMEEQKKTEEQKKETFKEKWKRIGKGVWLTAWEWTGQPALLMVVCGFPTIFFLNQIFAFDLPYTVFKVFAAGAPWFLAYLVIYLATPAVIHHGGHPRGPSAVMMVPMMPGMGGLPGEQLPGEGDGGHGPH